MPLLSWLALCACSTSPAKAPTGAPVDHGDDGGDELDGSAGPGPGLDGGSQGDPDSGGTQAGDADAGGDELPDGSTLEPEPPPFVPPGITQVRAPAYPLITTDPYFSIWSYSDKLCESFPRHWTNRVHAMTSLVRVDGTAYRLMGLHPSGTACAEQTSVLITPTRTIYTFESGGVEVRLSFMTPSFADDLDQLSRSVGYITWDVRATDGQSHAVELYFDNSAELVVNDVAQVVTWDSVAVDGLLVRRMGTVDQPILAKKGDDLRIDWGYLHQATKAQDGVTQVVASDLAARDGFAATGAIPAIDDAQKPRAAEQDWPVIAATMELPAVTSEWTSRTVLLVYDDIYSIEHMTARLRPYWRRNGTDAIGLIGKAASEYEDVFAKAKAFDAEFVADLESVGGADFRRLAVLSYRQALAAHKLVAAPDGTPLYFSKENFSNGCIATVDVTYPSAPLFLLLNPALLKGMVKPVADYAGSPSWPYSYAPHDLGTYPLANGQVYGMGSNDGDGTRMPVEESGNMLLLFAAIARAEGSTAFAESYLPLLKEWAAYLEGQGFDPQDQLSTDDFAGHLARNVNLSAKAIVALGSFVQLLEQTGDAAEAARLGAKVEEFASNWQTQANDGDHTRLAFDRANTWSQKYNLVWDRLLGLGLFPASVAERELAYARSKLNAFGLPLDSRREYTKLDWIVWTATLTGKRDDLDFMIAPLMDFLDQSPSRVPLTDWFDTLTAEQEAFQARSVVGGVFLPALYDEALWQKWLGRLP